MKETTLAYIEHEGNILMLFRNKKENDLNEGKWIGVGGHMEEGETPMECIIRETFEECGLSPKEVSFTYRGIMDFESDTWEDEKVHIFYGISTSDTVKECSEGILKWISKKEITSLNLWEGDMLFLVPLFETDDFIHILLKYKGDTLVEYKFLQ